MAKNLFGRKGRLSGIKSVAMAVRMASASGGPSVGERLGAVPRLAKAVHAGEYHGTSATQLGLLAAAAAYIASPVDLLPEALLGVVGLADDAVVLTWFGSNQIGRAHV